MIKKGCLLLYLTVLVCGPGHAGKEFPEEMPASPSLSVPSTAPPSTVQTASVGNFKLRLAGCRLTYEGAGKTGAVDFDFSAPCQFNRNATGEVRVVRTGKNRTLLVESSRPADPSTRLSAKDCTTSIRGIIVTPQEIRFSVQTQQVTQCLPADWDEKMFHAFAAKTQSAASLSR
jgi:hypothetical protein